MKISLKLKKNATRIIKTCNLEPSKLTPEAHENSVFFWKYIEKYFDSVG